MYKFYLFLLLLIGISCSNDALEDNFESSGSNFLGKVEWVKNFGGSGEDTGQSIIQTIDGGYAILGFSNSVDGDLQYKTLEVNDYWLLKLDAEGNLQWNQTYGGSKDDRGQSLVQTFDGGYALTGYAMSDDGDGSVNQGFHDNWLLKLDASGAIEWEKSFGFSGHDHSYDILQTDDGGFFFTGFLDITSARADGNTEKGNTLTRHGVGEFWGTKIDASANLQWRGYFGGSNNDRSHAVVRSEDGGFVMAGFSESDDFDISSTQGSYDYWLVKIDGQGNFLWERSFGGSGIEISYDIDNTLDGGYVVAGNSFSVDGDIGNYKGESDFWLIKVDDFGKLIWERSYGGTGFDAAQAVRSSKDGGYYVVGNSKSSDLDATSNSGENDIWIIKTDNQGSLIWQQSFGGTGIDFGYDVVEGRDGSVVLVGASQSSDFPDITSKGKTDLIIIKLR
ncbi:hypothetical protein PP182_19260 [Maribacter sp. PR1]|uniref:Bulb-type lectin domain-containing protein n=1 Tax=Maribacter cobaltidurans TaxID=1178778 RepID=A0ABU7IZ94_9FLAO|nr:MULTISPECIES: hypothetical protein [Maribacter]MDC6390833.1 hypothetical protein [Maribacter sp. PR1]MEE1978225.1 hypothetical protein [Maribacter cobaltidurans]